MISRQLTKLVFSGDPPFLKRYFQILFFPILAVPWTQAEEFEPLSILKENCVRCHTPAKRKGGLVMDSRDSLLKGGETGEAIIPGNSGGSYLIETLFPDADSHMPPKGQLKPREITTLEEWIDEGAPWDNEKWQKLNAPKAADVTLTSVPENYQPVLAMALSTDGKWLAAARADEIDIYEILFNEDPKKIPTFEHRASLNGHRDVVQSLDFSPDGKTLASGGFRRVVLWKTEDWSQQKQIDEEATFLGRLSAVEFSADSQTLLIADSLPAQTAQIHQLEIKNEALKTVVESAHDDSIFDLEFSPDGKQFASASADKLVTVRDAKSFETQVTLEGHTAYVLAVAFGPEGKRIATAGDDEAIKVWEVETGKQISTFSSRNAGAVTGVAWTTDPGKVESREKEKDAKKREAINTDRIVAINELGKPGTFTDLVEHEGEQRSAGAKEKAHIAAEESLASMVYDPVSLMLFAGTETGTIFIWDKDGKRVQQLDSLTAEVAQNETKEVAK